MKRILTIVVNASLCGFLMVGGTLPVRAKNQPVSQPRQLAVVGTVIYLPLVIQSVPPVTPTVDVKVNAGDGPVNLTNQDTFTVSWTSTNASSCTGAGAMAGKSGLSGSYTDGPKAAGSYTYTMSCSNAGGTVSDSVVVNAASSLLTVTSISAGGFHTCVLTAAGGVKCWGYNQDGELGNGTTTDSLIPVDVVGLGSGVDSISAGYKHTCALMKAGGVKCWGFNADGQLGDGTRISRSTPVDVYNLTADMDDVRAGGFHTCARKTTGVIRCWGNNDFGQLADGSTAPALTSVKADQFPASVGVYRPGQYHTCILTVTGGVQCLGNNGSGQLGDGTTTDNVRLVSVSGLTSGVTVLAAGASHTCAINAASGLMCWGYNGYGQLGNNSTVSSSSPVNVSGMTSGVNGVNAGLRHTCAQKSGVLKCWGDNYYGQLGNATTNSSSTPVNVTASTDELKSVRVGYYHTCALTQTGGVRCWGDNEYGQLGNGLTTSSSVPVSVIGFP